MLHTEGLVLRTVKYGETSLIAEILTLEKGIQSFIIGGVRTPKGGRKKSISQLMSFVDLVSYFRTSNQLNRVKEVSFNVVYRNLPFDLIRRSVGLFILEIIRSTIIESEYEPEIYHFIKKHYLLLDEIPIVPSIYPIKFMLEFTRFLGFYPGAYPDRGVYFDLQNGVFTKEMPGHVLYALPDLAASLEALRVMDLSATSPSPPKAVREELFNLLLDYYALHMEHFKEPVSRAILKEILT